MYFTIIDGKALTLYLAKLFIAEGHEVAIIEEDEKIAKEIADELDVNVIIEDASEPKVLQEINLKESDYIIILSDNDERNLVISLLAKENGAKKIAAKLTNTDYKEETLKRVGIDIAIHPEATMASYIVEMLTKPKLVDLAFLTKGDAEILELNAEEETIGKKVKDLKLPKNSSLFAIYDNNNKLIIPNEDTVIKKGYKLLVLSKT